MIPLFIWLHVRMQQNKPKPQKVPENFTLEINTFILEQAHHGDIFTASSELQNKERKGYKAFILSELEKYLHLSFGTHLSILVNCRRLVGENSRYGPYGVWSCPAAASE